MRKSAEQTWRTRRRNRTGAWYFTLMLALVLNSAFGCREQSPPDNSERDGEEVPVQVEEANIETIRESIKGIGTLRAMERVELRPELSGILIGVHFEEGHQVKNGQTLFTIDDTELQRRKEAQTAAHKAAQARLTNARWNLERIQRLRGQQAATEEEYKNARDTLREASAEVERMQAEIAVIEKQIADARIVAPLEGWISHSRVDPGDLVDKGDHLATIYRYPPLEIEFTVPERYVGHVQEGKTLNLMVASFPDEPFTGEVVYVAPAVDLRTRSLLIKGVVEDENRSLKPGMFAQAEIILENRRAHPVISEECLYSDREGYGVFVVRNQKAWRRPVRIGRREPGRVEILEGLEAGELVVRRGHLRLSDGAAVRIVDSQDTQPSGSSAVMPVSNLVMRSAPSSVTAPQQSRESQEL